MFKNGGQKGKKYPHDLFDSIREFLSKNELLKDELYRIEIQNTLDRAMRKMDPEVKIRENDIIKNLVNIEHDQINFKKSVIEIFKITSDIDEIKKRLLENLSDNSTNKNELSDIINKVYERQNAQNAEENVKFKAVFRDGFSLIKWKKAVQEASKNFPDFHSFKEQFIDNSFGEGVCKNESIGNLLDKMLRDDPYAYNDTFTNIVDAKFNDLLVKTLSAYGFKSKEILEVYAIVKLHDTEEDRLELKKLMFEKPLIVPPGLSSAVRHFEAHFAVSGDEPIMILGQTGVGKSMFLYLAKSLFKIQHQYDPVPPVIVEANCAHFSSGGSGYSLARSELFGHVKGAYTDAKKDKIGLVEKAHGGLLILEEVGELPFEVQAMLLTFIETGEYRRLGDEKLERASVRVVAATNRESALREDFRYRFFPYYIPPLRERKTDVLYYFYEIFPELTKNFSKSEVLMLLSHHWPGNVREIERIGRLLNRERWIKDQAQNALELSEDTGERLSHLDPRDTTFDPTILKRFVNDLKTRDVDIPFLEKLLQKHRVSVNDEGSQTAFIELSNNSSGYFAWFDQHTLRFCEEYSPFSEAYVGFLLFCDLFLQDHEKKDNILATIKNQCRASSTIAEFNYMLYGFDDKPSYQQPLKKLRKKIMRYLVEAYSPKYDHIDNPWELWTVLEQDRLESNIDFLGIEPGSKEVENAIAEYKEVDLLKLYYRKQMEKTGGNVKATAKLIGMNENTFRNRLKRLKMETAKK